MMNERQYGGPARLAGTNHSVTDDQKKHYLSIPILSCVLKYKCNNGKYCWKQRVWVKDFGGSVFNIILTLATYDGHSCLKSWYKFTN